MTQIPGTLLKNRYRIEAILGQGGMGAVYRATDENLNISVAVKENLFLSEEYARQFEREASILARMRHENLPRVGDYFSIPGEGQYLIMDYIPGEDLRQRIERLGVVPEQEVILIGISICDGLGYMRSRKPPIVHRDIKPGNIKITPEGEVVLVDFGLAKIMLDDQATTTGARAMTPGYSPPEQYGTARTDARSDVYSLGATLYAALSGTIPEDGLSRATGKAKLTPLRTLKPGLSKKTSMVIEKALSVEPDDRFQTPEDFKETLLEAGNFTQSVHTRIRIPPPPIEPVSKETNYSPGSDQLLNSPSEIPINNNYLDSGQSNNQNRLLFSLIGLLVIVGLIAYYFINPNYPDEIVSLVYSSSTDPTENAIPTRIESPAPTKSVKAILANTPTLLQNTETLEPTSTPLPTTAITPIFGEAALGGGTGKITFITDRTGSFQVWTMDTNGENQQQYTSIAGGVCQPNWSPDGKQLVVISPCESSSTNIYYDTKIYLVSEDGSSLEKLPFSELGDFDPVWSPDGKRIAFSSNRGVVPHVFIYNFDSDALEEISDTQYPDIQPAWNPSGKQLAVVRNINFFDIWLISDKGESFMRFSSVGPLYDFWPNWSSDGSTMIYSRTALDPIIPYMVKHKYEDRGVGLEKRVPSAEQGGDAPAAKGEFSPDGEWITFESWPDGNNHDIYLIRLNGEDRQRLTTDPGRDADPCWRPNPSS